jgi:MFS family permease
VSQQSDEVGGRYSKYVLGVLVLVYVFNFIDRQILSILAEEIKADLGITDAQIGFLYGTAFAVFYAVFGIPLGKLADVWTRKSLISVGLGFWSLMTALSGTARNFGTLAVFRFGVGVGEASATPAAFSMLSDHFPPKLRATALAIYSSGIYIGAGLGILMGGVIVDVWKDWYPDPSVAPFGLAGWQAAFFIVGLPGLLMAIWVWTLREPRRGQSDGIETAVEPHPFRVAGRELVAVLPPLTLIAAARNDGKALLINVLAGLAIAAMAYGLIEWGGNPAQWIALGVGVYATFSWTQNLRVRDPATYAMIFGSRTMRCITVGIPCIAFVTYGVGFWGPPFMLRAHAVDLSDAATILGLSAALGGLMGVAGGGWLADRMRARYVNGRLYVVLAGPILSLPFGWIFLHADTLWVVYAANFAFQVFSPMWIGGAAGTVNDMVMPRMRAIASAYYILMITFIGLALGPFLIGQLSDSIASTGVASGDALRGGMEAGLLMMVVSLVFLIPALRFLPREEANRLERARAAGESIPA